MLIWILTWIRIRREILFIRRSAHFQKVVSCLDNTIYILFGLPAAEQVALGGTGRDEDGETTRFLRWIDAKIKYNIYLHNKMQKPA